MKTNQQRNDAGESLFMARQLEHIESTVYRKEFPEYLARSLFPVSNEGGPGVKLITYKMLERVGQAQAISDYAKDFRRVNLKATEHSAKVKDFGESISYSIDEMESAKRNGFNLDGEYAEAAREGYEQTFDEVCFNGDAAHGIMGFNSNPNIPLYTVGTGVGGNTWALKTSDEIVTDVSTLISSVTSLTKGRERVNTVLLPDVSFELISRKRLTDSSESVLSYLQKVNPGVQFIGWWRMNDAGVSGVKRMTAYKRDPSRLQAREPEAFQIYPFQQDMLTFKAPAKGKIGGVVVRYPLSAAHMDGL